MNFIATTKFWWFHRLFKTKTYKACQIASTIVNNVEIGTFAVNKAIEMSNERIVPKYVSYDNFKVGGTD